jgi:hypothetical protein
MARIASPSEPSRRAISAAETGSGARWRTTRGGAFRRAPSPGCRGVWRVEGHGWSALRVGATPEKARVRRRCSNGVLQILGMVP